jgi:chorismate mutase
MPDTAISPDLAAARAEIDAIDAEMHALLMKRAGVVARIEAAKRVAPGRSAYRPAREADMMRRLVARHRGPFPLASAEHIWREIVTAFIRLQAPFTVHLAAASPDARDLARFQFGSATPLVVHPDAQTAIAQLESRPSDIILIPFAEDGAGAWWDRLGGADGAMIVARIPFLLGAVSLPPAWVVARIRPEPSGDDRTLLALRGPASLAPDTLSGRLAAKTLAARIVDGEHYVLAALDGFQPPDTAFAYGARVVGAYAVPLKTE